MLESVLKEDHAKYLKYIQLATSQLPQEHALCAMWNTEMVKLTFKFIPKNKLSMERGLLSVIRLLYDPLGFL